MGQSSSASIEGEGKAVLGASAHERLKKADFSELAHTDLADLERISLRLLQQMSLRLSRRIKNIAARGKIDLRRTIRRSIGRGGEPIDLSFRRKKLQQLKLVIVLDVSGSMNPYSIFFVRFAFALQKYFKRVDTFLFSTQLTEITSALRARQLRDALDALAQQAAGWSGGTKIGDSLRDLNHASWAASFFPRYSVHGPQRRMGHRGPGNAGRGVERHQAARAQADLAEPAAGNGGLPADHSRHERGAALHRCLCSGA